MGVVILGVPPLCLESTFVISASSMRKRPPAK
jgi:hypothetical protein